MKVSDLSVNSQKTLKWLFTVDCQKPFQRSLANDS